MFLGIDRQPSGALALKDNEGYILTYGELVKEVRSFCPDIKTGAVVFQLCKNTVGSMVGYLSFVERGVVPLMLSSKIDNELLESLLETYTPAYLWVPTEEVEKFHFKALYSNLGYTLLETENELYPINDKLQLLMTTSGSTGSPKLVRYKKGNLEANAEKRGNCLWME